MNIAIIGSRTFNDYNLFKRILIEYISPFCNCYFEGITIYSGGAKGADMMAENIAYEYNIPIKIFRAEWDKYGKKAGFIRNQDIIENSNLFIAFWDGKSLGTKHSISLAYKKKIPTFIYYI